RPTSHGTATRRSSEAEPLGMVVRISTIRPAVRSTTKSLRTPRLFPSAAMRCLAVWPSVRATGVRQAGGGAGCAVMFAVWDSVLCAGAGVATDRPNQAIRPAASAAKFISPPFAHRVTFLLQRECHNRLRMSTLGRWVLYRFQMDLRHSSEARSCFDKLSTNGRSLRRRE